MIHCLQCGAETANGLALCELCQRMARMCLEYLPIYFRNLARWQPGRAGSRDIPGSRVLYMGEVSNPDGTGDRISDRLDETNNALVTWARALTNDRPYLMRLLDRLSAARAAERIDEATAVAWLCKGFDRYLTSVSTLDWCGEFVRDLSYHEDKLRRLTETAVPGWYAGACHRCKVSTYVVPGLTWVTCGGCGVTTYARDHLETILDEARGWVARPRRVAEAIVALVDNEQSVDRLYERIKKWEQREKVTAVRKVDADGDKVGAKRYRFGDVLNLLTNEGQTRLGPLTVKAS